MKETFERLVDHMIVGGFFLEEAVELLETTLIRRALERTGGNRSAASKALGIHRNTLQKKVLEYKLDLHPIRRKAVQKAGRHPRRAAAG